MNRLTAAISIKVDGVEMRTIEGFDADEVFTSGPPQPVMTVTVPLNYRGRATMRRLFNWANGKTRPSRGWARHVRSQKALAARRP